MTEHKKTPIFFITEKIENNSRDALHNALKTIKKEIEECFSDDISLERNLDILNQLQIRLIRNSYAGGDSRHTRLVPTREMRELRSDVERELRHAILDLAKIKIIMNFLREDPTKEDDYR